MPPRQRWEPITLPSGVTGIEIELIRPEDLLSLRCVVTAARVTSGPEGPVLEPDGDDALLIVDHGFQHGFEEAIYEQVPAGQTLTANPDDPSKAPIAASATGQTTATTGRGIGFRPARRSRVVFAVGDTPIPLSTEGILAAMQSLPLALHPLATPSGTAPVPATPLGSLADLVVLHVGDGLVANLGASGVIIRKADADFLRQNPAPDATSVDGAFVLSQNLNRVKAASAVLGPAVLARGTRISEDSPFRPGAGLTRPDFGPIPPVRLRRSRLSRPASDTETSIEAPFRLAISPSQDARFAHALNPVRAHGTSHAELWHSRLATAPAVAGAVPDEKTKTNRIVRAIWARDRDWVGEDWQTAARERDPDYRLRHPDSPASAEPFLGSLDALDRHMLVRQTAESWFVRGAHIAPRPLGADALWLSALGAWLKVNGTWDTGPYSAAGIQSILSYDHIAPMGRDQFVRVVYPGYLYPFGHQAALVKITERKIKTQNDAVAGLYQRMFLVVGDRTRTYGERRLPFTRVDVRPLVSPPLDFPPGGSFANGVLAEGISTAFWPKVGGQDFRWTLNTMDHDGQPGVFSTPLLWVAESFTGTAAFNATDALYAKSLNRAVNAAGQQIAYVPKQGSKPDSRLESSRLYFLGRARFKGSEPTMSAAQVVLPAVQRISKTPPLAIRYRDEYVSNGLGAPGVGDVWALVNEGTTPPAGAGDPTSPPTAMKFGGGGAGSDKSGGFISPNLPVRAISASTGPVGDVAGASSQTFDPQAFLAGAAPRLFGLLNLVDLLVSTGVLPAVVTDTLGRAQQFAKDALQGANLAQSAVAEANAMVQRAASKSAQVQQQATAALAAAQQLKAAADALAARASALVDLTGQSDQDLVDLAAEIVGLVNDAAAALETAAPLLTPLLRDACRRQAGLLRGFASDAATVVTVLRAARELIDEQALSFHFRWAPQLQNWPSNFPIFVLDERGSDHLVLAVEGRVAADGESHITAMAELRDFSLNLFGTDPLMRIPFDHMTFKAGSSGKPEIDVVLGEIEFLGPLSFVEIIKDLIPLDGFSDPPYLEVSPDGARAGFTLALPSVAIGVFNLSNMSLGADVHVPFIGKSVTVGFNFCTRERPFTLTVMCLGGGGWFLVRVAPDGLDLLEIGLEATACLAVNLGVASGSISASIGIYLRLEGEKGSLTGYFRLRGEVDVLGLISASIELYLELIYHFNTGKMIGRATITVQVKVLCFSGSVKISAERQFAGSNGDPSFREILGAEAGTSPYWNDYAAAFAEEV